MQSLHGTSLSELHWPAALRFLLAERVWYYPHAPWKEVLLSRHSSALRSATEGGGQIALADKPGARQERTAEGRHMVRSGVAIGPGPPVFYYLEAAASIFVQLV